MININMDRKDGINRINIGVFDVENNVLTLQIDVGEYPLEGKTITAVFEGKPETAPLIAEEGIIKLPITADLVEPGINKIQLNFRWDGDKLEQSPILWWSINKSLLPEGVAQESVDIINYLISEVNRIISETGDIKEAIDESITNANTINDILANEVTGTIKVATDASIDLEDIIEDANYTKGLVEATIDDSETAKTNLEGTIGAAGTAQTNLTNKIGEANTSKQVLDQAVIDNQIVTLPVFNQHKLDYASYLESELQESHVLRSLPNGVRDEIVNGELVKRISDDFLTVSSKIGAYIEYSNVGIIVFSLSLFANLVPQTTGLNGSLVVQGKTETVESQADNIAEIGKFYTNTTQLGFIVAKGSYTTTTNARNNFPAQTLNYQLTSAINVPLPLELTPNTKEILRLGNRINDKINIQKTEETLGFNLYPFQRRATLSLSKQISLDVLNAIKDIRLFGASLDKKYYISILYRYTASNGVKNNIIYINDESNVLVSRFDKKEYIEPSGTDKVDLIEQNNSGITGYMQIDWAKLTYGTQINGDYNSFGLDDRVKYELIEQHPTNLYQSSKNIRNLRDYYLQNIEESTPIINSKQAHNTLSFSVITDSHLTKDYDQTHTSIATSIEAISYLAEYADLDFIAILGDLIVGDLPKEESLKLINETMLLAKAHSKCPVYAIKGNHDANDMPTQFVGKTEQEKIDILITNKEYYQAVTRKCEQYDIIVDENNPYGSYYYVNFPRQKIRAVFLNTSEMIEEDSVPVLERYIHVGVRTKAQFDWLSNVALKVDEGWAVMILSHIPPIAEEFMHSRGTVTATLTNMVKGFMNGTSGTTTDIYGTVADYDFTLQGAREYIGFFHGHVHEDSHGVVDGINYFINNSTTPWKRWDTSLERENEGLKTLSANTIIIDRDTHTVKITKTGIGIDYEFTW